MLLLLRGAAGDYEGEGRSGAGEIAGEGEEGMGRERVRVRDWVFDFLEEAAVAIGANEIAGGRGNRDGALALVAEVLARLAGDCAATAVGAAGRRHVNGKIR